MASDFSPKASSPLNEKTWMIEIDSQSPGRGTKVYYKGELVGLLQGIEFGVNVGDTFPKVTFTVFMSNVDIRTVDHTKEDK